MAADRDDLLLEYCRTRSDSLLDELCRQYLPLAKAIARRFSGRGVEYDDLFQVASMALLKALNRFDPDKGVQFSTYVTPTIVGEVKNYFRDKSRLISLPRRSGALLRRIDTAREKLTASLQRSPTVEELANETGETMETILEMLEMQELMTPVSLDTAPSSEDDDLSLHAILGAEEAGYQEIEQRDMLKRAMSALSENEQMIILKRFYENRSQREISQQLGVSQMTISRMEKKALEHIRKLIGEI